MERHQQAVTALQAALRHCADKDKAQLESLLAETRSAEAAQAEEQFAQMTPAQKLKEQGNREYKTGRFESAIGFYSQAAEAMEAEGDMDGVATVLNNRGTCHKQLGNHDGVVTDCSRALEIQPNNIKALIRRGQAYESLGKWQSALDDMNAAFRLDPNAKLAAEARPRLQKYIKSSQEL